MYADIIIIAVPSEEIQNVCHKIGNVVKDKIVISTVATVPFKTLFELLPNDHQKIVRLIPTLPIAEKKGLLGITTNRYISFNEQTEIIELFSQLGKVFVFSTEAELDAMMLLSTPGLVTYIIQAMTKSGERLGLSSTVSQEITMQSFLSTITYLSETKELPEDLQKSVSTNGGITEAMLAYMNENHMDALFMQTMLTKKKIRD